MFPASLYWPASWCANESTEHLGLVSHAARHSTTLGGAERFELPFHLFRALLAYSGEAHRGWGEHRGTQHSSFLASGAESAFRSCGTEPAQVARADRRPGACTVGRGWCRGRQVLLGPGCRDHLESSSCWADAGAVRPAFRQGSCSMPGYILRYWLDLLVMSGKP